MSAVVDFPVKPEARPYLDSALGRAGEPDWLARYRRRSLARFAEQGFPSRRDDRRVRLVARRRRNADVRANARSGD